MSTLLDQETVVLDAHDFTPRCNCRTIGSGKDCGQAATHWLSCTACGSDVGLACTEHAEAVADANWTVTHATCGSSAPMCDLVRAVRL